ncbi:MAG: peptidylprolyl isomerase [Chlamydiales bacterium]|jgi:peptidylprolyl isomerase
MARSMTKVFLFLAFLILNNKSIEATERQFMMPINPIIVIETNQGNIEIALKPDVAPKACENLIRLAEDGYYNGVIFHRVIKGFMVQGGDPTGTGAGGQSVWGESFEDEVNVDVVFDRPGILAMANAGPDTNGSQFFITTAETPWLNMRHTIFGEVITGYDIVEKIENMKTSYGDKPVEVQKILNVTVKKKDLVENVK